MGCFEIVAEGESGRGEEGPFSTKQLIKLVNGRMIGVIGGGGRANGANVGAPGFWIKSIRRSFI